tara:strand:+ start:1554 stop:2048 length:495 start_codon:yes stop_codon:yes gene_type:complete
MLTMRETARIQTFPDDYEFVGSKKDVYMQIGNAVPCLLAKHIALAIKKMDNNYLEITDDDEKSKLEKKEKLIIEEENIDESDKIIEIFMNKIKCDYKLFTKFNEKFSKIKAKQSKLKKINKNKIQEKAKDNNIEIQEKKTKGDGLKDRLKQDLIWELIFVDNNS